MSKKSILIVVTSHSQIDHKHTTGSWFEDFAVPFEIFVGHDLSTTVASIEGGAAPIDPQSMPNDIHHKETRLALDALSHTEALGELDFERFDAVFFPGGHGAMVDLPENPHVAAIVGNYLSKGKVVAALCHGTAALLGAKRKDGSYYVRDRDIAVYSDAEEVDVKMDTLMPFMLEDKFCAIGAVVHTTPKWHVRVVIDENLITGQNTQSAENLAKAVVDALLNA